MSQPDAIATIPVQKPLTAEPRSVYEVGIQELHRVSQDEAARRQVDHDLNEARGRDGARLHVTLSAITEVDRRGLQNARATIETLEHHARALEARIESLHRALATLDAAIENRVAAVQTEVGAAQRSMLSEVQEARNRLAAQTEAGIQSLSVQTHESTDRIAVDVRKLRDEVVSLVDSRMNQADASFAALRGDVEVVKYLVMDLIKDRIGRPDVKKSY